MWSRCFWSTGNLRLWSVQPVFYLWHLFLSSAVGSDGPNLRLLIMAALVTGWGGRLSYNFYVKGGFSGGEDYRWKEVRSWYPGVRYEVFNLVFVCCFQQLEILAFTTPAVLALQSNRPLNSLDAVAAFGYAFLVAFEAVADAQMLKFQTEKYRRIKSGEPLGPSYEHGFCREGLWAISRCVFVFACMCAVRACVCARVLLCEATQQC